MRAIARGLFLIVVANYKVGDKASGTLCEECFENMGDSMRILILGGDGMLGHQLLLDYQDRHDVKVTLRKTLSEYEGYGLYNQSNAITGVDVRDMNALQNALQGFSPEVVINATGIVKQANEAKAHIPSIEINALFPHKLADLCKGSARVVHMSTDCVFSGKQGHYNEDDFPDADDLYGRSKLLGELGGADCITLRTSIIGLELARKRGLVEWFLMQKGDVHGYTKAIYSGFTTRSISRLIEFVLTDYPELHGVWHVASSPINKCELLSKLSTCLHRSDITVHPDDSFVCDRSLDAARFNAVTGYAAPSWDEMLDELARQIQER